MKNKPYLGIIKSTILILLIFFSVLESKSQEIKPDTSVEKYKAIYVEFGGNYYHFRDLASSKLSYEGFGGGRVGLGFHRLKGKVHQEGSLFFDYGENKYQEAPNEDYSNVYRLFGRYSIYWEKSKPNNKFKWTFGGAITSDALYIVYPFLVGNNGDSYSIDLLALEPNVGVTREFKKSRIALSCYYGIAEWNFRPQSYHGGSPELFFSEHRITSIHNNTRISFRTSYIKYFKKGGNLEIAYSWHFRRNKSTIKMLNFAQHNLTLRYHLVKKNT